MYTEKCIKELREKVDLVSVLEEFLDVFVRTDGHSATCPFCDEVLSLKIDENDPSKYYCIECHARGDAITFLTTEQEMSPDEALKYLFDKFDVELEYCECSKQSDEESINKVIEMLKKLLGK